MTLQAILAKLETKRESLRHSQDDGIRFTLCGIQCRMWYGSDTGLYMGPKRSLMTGFDAMSIEDLAAHIYRFQF